MIRPRRKPAALFLLVSLLPSTLAAAAPGRFRRNPATKVVPQRGLRQAHPLGPFGVLGEGEWVLNTRGMSVSDYERLSRQFNPTESVLGGRS